MTGKQDLQAFAQKIAELRGRDAEFVRRLTENLEMGGGLWQGREAANASKQRDCCGGAAVDHTSPAS